VVVRDLPKVDVEGSIPFTRSCLHSQTISPPLPLILGIDRHLDRP
jgi:hypothetical protein